MRTMRVSEARANLYRLVDEVAQMHEPVKITGKHGNAVIVGEDDWRAVEETLYVLSVPGMRESIIEGMATPVADCASTPDW